MTTNENNLIYLSFTNHTPKPQTQHTRKLPVYLIHMQG